MTRPRLLIAHTDASTLSMLGSMLRSLNFETIEAASDDTALGALARDPGVVLLGVDPSGPDALGLFGLIRRECPECPVVLLFSAPDAGLAARASRMGAVTLRFPVPASQLRAAVIQALDCGTYLPPAWGGRRDEPAGALRPPPGPLGDEPGATEAPAACACSDEIRPADETPIRSLKEALEGPERVIILRTLEALGWSLGKTAKALDINRSTLYKKMKKYGLCEGHHVESMVAGSDRAKNRRKVRA